MGFIDDQQGSGAAGDFAQRRVEALVGQNHADIGHDGFGQNAGHIAGCKGCFKGRDIIELDDLGQLSEIIGFADEGAVGFRLAMVEVHIGFIHGAMVAMVEDEDFLAAGYGAAPAQHRAVGV